MQSIRRHPGRVLVLAGSMLILVSLACSPIVTPIPKLAEQTAAVPSRSEWSPKAGRWEGEPSVSFEITSEGDLRNLKIVAPFGVLAGQHCTIEVDQVSVEPRGQFTIGEGENPPVYVDGKFTDHSNLVGSYKITVCKVGDEATVVLDPKEESWHATWRGPREASEAPFASPTATPERPTSTPLQPTITLLPTVTAPQISEATDEPTPVAGRWSTMPGLPRQVNALVVDPGDSDMVYAGTGSMGAGSGVYRSEDAGVTWQKASSGLPSEDVRALAFSRTTPTIIYVAAGHRGDVFASTDGATSWTRLGNYDLTGSQAELVVAPTDGSLLFIAEDVRGLYRSHDGGHNWTACDEGLPKDENGSAYVQSVAIAPFDSNVVYAGTGMRATNGNGVYQSTDGGETWAPANQGMVDYGITALALNPADSQIIYAGAANGELFKSTNGAANWTDLTDQLPLENSFHQRILDISVDPDEPETIYLLHERVGVLLSTDGGAKWRLLGSPPEAEHPMFTAMAVVFHPAPLVLVGIRDEGAWRYTAEEIQ